MSFHAGQMQGINGGVQRLRQTTPDGEVTLMRVGDLEFVDIVPKVSGGMWQFIFNIPSPWPLGEMADYPYQKSLNCTIYLKIGEDYYGSSFSIDNRLLPKTCIWVWTGITLTGFSNYYLQLYDILTVDADIGTTVSFKLRILDNLAPYVSFVDEVLVYSFADNPAEVTGAEFLCKYNVNIGSYDIFSYYPYPGYVIAEDFINWHSFTSDGWLKADNSKYSVDIVMMKYDGTLFDNYLGQDTMQCDYLNNSKSDLYYVPSSEATDPILEITDNYDYHGNLYNYIGEIVNSETTYFIDGETPFRIACKVGWDYRDFYRLGDTFRYNSQYAEGGHWQDGTVWHWEDEEHTIGHWEQVWDPGVTWYWGFVHTPILLPTRNTIITKDYSVKKNIIVPTEISS